MILIHLAYFKMIKELVILKNYNPYNQANIIKISIRDVTKNMRIIFLHR